ncbi:DinB family protein [Paenibacillus herberti]|uniref:DinB-like domain-containing protein n=1 Tax=Paenibacillus herberti TaxID=1619309 RepID=A0A229P4H3_9BACL|nr:DinB family protein [Paenibacillus herberti]OXM16825.1 hypothetical protein CGZ75_09285 [Paenibacillus herberti]
MDAFIEKSLSILDVQLEHINKCFDRLTDELIFYRPRVDLNSVANLCIHITENEYHHIVNAIGGTPYVRNRSSEFTLTNGLSIRELREKMSTTREESRRVLQGLSSADLSREVQIIFSEESNIPPTTTSVLDCIYKTVEHYSYHTGQIILLTKITQNGTDRLFKLGH